MTEPERYVEMPWLTDEEKARIQQEFKIPVDSFCPAMYWIASIDYTSCMPTDHELRMIRSYIEYSIRHTYNETYQEKILAKPLPAEGGHRTKIFRKGARWQHQENPTEGWCFMRHGNECYWPVWPAPRRSLTEILDYINDLGGELYKPWVEWKTRHPDVFGTV